MTMTTNSLHTIDTITARLSQAQAVLSACRAAGDTLTQGEVLDALWATQELLAQAQAAASELHPG